MKHVTYSMHFTRFSFIFLIFFFWLNLITASSHRNDMRGTQGKGRVALFQSHHKQFADDTCHVLVFNRGSRLFVLNVQTTCQI